MTTTIQIKDETHELLKKIRQTVHAHSFDEAILAMAKRGVSKSESFYGILGKKSIEYVLKGLRDKSDRY